jgi:hypothetical protein
MKTIITLIILCCETQGSVNTYQVRSIDGKETGTLCTTEYLNEGDTVRIPRIISK